jgi:hypothetical protein
MHPLKIVVFELDFIHHKLAPGLAASGDEVEISDKTYVDCDVAVIMWSPRCGQPDRARAARSIRNLHGKNLLIIETPTIRCVEAWHFRVGFDHVHRGGRFFAKDMPDDRSAGMKLKLAPWKSEEGAIIIAGQFPGDFSLDGLDAYEWVVDVATYIERRTERKIVIRPHPLDFSSNWFQLASSLGVEISRDPLHSDLARASTWIAYTSGSAIDAVMSGVPTICLSPANFAWDVSGHSLAGLEKPWTDNRSQWLANLAYTQWTNDEIGNGRCWRHLRGLTEPDRQSCAIICAHDNMVRFAHG